MTRLGHRRLAAQVGQVVADIVVAGHRDNPVACLQPGKAGRELRRVAFQPVLAIDEVAGQQNQVGALGIHRIDDFRQPGGAHRPVAEMDVGQ